MLLPRTGEHAFDLYGGAGLFAAALAPLVGPAGRVTVVESDPSGVAAARRNLAELAHVRVVSADVARSVESTVDELLTRLRLAHLARANPHTLSGGEQRRLSVATALATAPPLLVLDEPTFGQDRRTWTDLLDLLAKLRDDGAGIAAVTHDADFVAALADRVLTLGGAAGGARAAGPTTASPAGPGRPAGAPKAGPR